MVVGVTAWCRRLTFTSGCKKVTTSNPPLLARHAGQERVRHRRSRPPNPATSNLLRTEIIYEIVPACCRLVPRRRVAPTLKWRLIYPSSSKKPRCYRSRLQRSDSGPLFSVTDRSRTGSRGVGYSSGILEYALVLPPTDSQWSSQSNAID